MACGRAGQSGGDRGHRRLKANSRRRAQGGRRQHRRPWPAVVHSVVLHGPTVSTLVNQSKIADMMVVGYRGEGALSRFPFGSVSTGLVNYAHCPVAVVHDEAPPPAQAPVLVGIDGSPASELATEIAFGEAFRRGVDLVALHAWSDVSMPEVPGLDLATIEAQAQEALAEWLARWQQRYPMSRCNVWWWAISRLVNLSSTRSPHNSSSSAVTAAADSPACCWAR